MKTFQRILAVVLCLVMSLSVLGTVAFAAEGDPQTTAATIDTSKTGSITVYKYEYNGTNTNDKGTGLESESNNLPKDDSALDDPSKTAIALGGVTFKIYQVKNTTETIAYYNGEATKSVTVASFLDKGKIKSEYSEYTEYENGLTTGEDGKVEFTNLPVGMYVIVESAAPENVTKAVEPFLVSIPMTHPTNLGEWMYDVYVYPKNSTSEGNVTLKKVDKDGNGIDGVDFKLEKLVDEKWVAVEEAEGDTTFTTAKGGVIPWNGLAFGDYQITEISAPKGYIVDGAVIEFTVNRDNTITATDHALVSYGTTNNTNSLTITLKNEKPDVDKEITNDSTTENDAHEDNAGVGDTVSYKISVYVPENITKMENFILTDTPTNLKDQFSTIKVNNSTDGKSEMFAAKESDNGFIITFDTSKMESVAGTTISVTYDAVVLATAASAEKAPNTAKLTYSSKIDSSSDTPDDGGDTYEIQDSAIVYTYKIQVEKRLDSDAGELAGNVEFELYEGNSTDPITVVKVNDGVYRKAAEGENDATTLVTGTGDNNKGKLVVTGLDSGTYQLKETKTVNNYNLLSGTVAVDLNIYTVTTWETTDTFEDGKLVKHEYTSTSYTTNGTDTSNNYVSTTIINKKGFDLPQTGGIGTLMFFIIGGVLIAGGICLITVPNKKRSV